VASRRRRAREHEEREPHGDPHRRIAPIEGALASQPGIEAAKLHDDFMRIAASDFGDPERLPSEIRDIAAAIRLAAADPD